VAPLELGRGRELHLGQEPKPSALNDIILDVMEADDKNDYDVADIVCEECKSIVTLQAQRAN